METENNLQIEEQLKGLLTVKFGDDKSFNQLCKDHFDNYDDNRFEAIAIRVFSGSETVVTLYALDKLRQEYGAGKLPVKKFKTTQLSLEKILPYIQEYNFTLTNSNYSLDEMEVVNK